MKKYLTRQSRAPVVSTRVLVMTGCAPDYRAPNVKRSDRGAVTFNYKRFKNDHKYNRIVP